MYRIRTIYVLDLEPTLKTSIFAIVIHFILLFYSPYPHATAQEHSFLIDNNDTNVLDFEPTLKTLSILAVVEHRIDTTWLPRELRYVCMKYI